MRSQDKPSASRLARLVQPGRHIAPPPVAVSARVGGWQESKAQHDNSADEFVRRVIRERLNEKGSFEHYYSRVVYHLGGAFPVLQERVAQEKQSYWGYDSPRDLHYKQMSMCMHQRCAGFATSVSIV